MTKILIVDGALFGNLEAEEENLETLERCLVSNRESDEEVMKLFVKSGQLKCIKWMCEHGCVLTDTFIMYSIIADRLDCLEYLIGKGCPCDPYIVSYTAMAGKVECLEYLIKSGYQVWEDIGASAAAKGQLEVLKWLHNNGIEFGYEASAYAASFGHTKCFEYIIECHEDGPLYVDPIGTIENGHLDCIKIMHELDKIPPVSADIAIMYNQMEIFNYLKDEGFKYNKKLLNRDGTPSRLAKRRAKQLTTQRQSE